MHVSVIITWSSSLRQNFPDRSSISGKDKTGHLFQFLAFSKELPANIKESYQIVNFKSGKFNLFDLFIMETSLKSISEDFLHLCAKGNARKAFSQYNVENIIHHNPFFHGDGKSLMLAMEK